MVGGPTGVVGAGYGTFDWSDESASSVPLAFKTEKGRLPDINSPDAWEKRMAEGVVALARYRAEERARETGASG